MSKHYQVYSESDTLEYNVQHSSSEELEQLYGIQFIENPGTKKGKVYDPVSGKEYPSLAEWMIDQVEEEEWSNSECHQNSRKYEEI